MKPVTIVTAFFDINRAEKGDGRTIEEYLEWAKTTLQLNCHLYVVTEAKFESFFVSNRVSDYPMTIKVITFEDSHYYRYYHLMKKIIQSDDYVNSIAYPKRVECVLPEYNIIQYSKFHYLTLAIEENPYQSEHFFWMDLGASRFFGELNLSLPYPTKKGQEKMTLSPNCFFAQHRRDLFYYPIDENFIWKADNLIYGGMFGGSSKIIQKMSDEVERVFVKEMLEHDNVNNEQLALALVWKKHPEWFQLINGNGCLETFHYFK